MIKINIKGVINSIENDKARISFVRPKSCGDCSSCSGCDIETTTIELKKIEGLKVGDVVDIEYKTSKMLKATALLYIVPLVNLVLGIIVGNYLQESLWNKNEEIISFLFGLGFLAITFLAINFFDKKFEGKKLIKIKKIGE